MGWYFPNEIASCHGNGHHRYPSHLSRKRHSVAHHRPTVGSRVCLTRFWRRRGPLRPGQEGVLVRDTHDYQPYYVRASNGRKWWYFPNEIAPCHGVERHNVRQHNRHHRHPSHLSRERHSVAHHRPTVGSRVCLTRFWGRRGPLKPGQEGVLVRDTHDYQPYYVRASNGRKWWYFPNEITSCHGVERHNVRKHHTVHVSHVRQSVAHNRPTVGSRVCLTRDWRRRGP